MTRIHALANITVLNERTNVNKLCWQGAIALPPGTPNLGGQLCAAHLIPGAYAAAANDKPELLEQRWECRSVTTDFPERAGTAAWHKKPMRSCKDLERGEYRYVPARRQPHPQLAL
ncbi:MAG: hypothetical protein KatS3mg087_1725 [Patescibacteria group bacterium]|nr:MAG: hypothetical protein KatS3mg087_1725 [Patescibacteria group bacterium]